MKVRFFKLLFSSSSHLFIVDVELWIFETIKYHLTGKIKKNVNPWNSVKFDGIILINGYFLSIFLSSEKEFALGMDIFYGIPRELINLLLQT